MILLKPVVAGWDLIPPCGHGSANNLKKVAGELSIAVMKRAPQVFRGNRISPQRAAVRFDP
jgi:hypothetical protein